MKGHQAKLQFLGFDLEPDLGPGLEHGLEPEWEYDQESLLVPGQEFVLEFDLGMDQGKFREGRDPLGRDLVLYQAAGSTTSGTLLK